MKIGILTHYDVNNMGAQLQMYATYNQLKSMGHEPIVLTYIKNYDFAYEEKLKNQVSIKSIPYYIKNYVFKKGIGLSVFNAKKFRKNKKFRDKSFNFCNYAGAQIDCALIGSDEVYSIPMGINIMMYGHGMLTGKVFSYAPSFGQTDLETIKKHNCEALISSGISNLTASSARDENTYKIVEQLTGQSAPNSLRPCAFI